MSVRVRRSDDAAATLDHASGYLASDPIAHNLIATLLTRVAETGDAGRYWLVEDAGRVVGITFQSPLHFLATVTPLSEAAAVATVDAIVDDDVDLPGVNGVASATAAFSGHWTERIGRGARPVEGMRIYEVDRVETPTPPPGAPRLATVEDRAVAIEWFEAFEAETGEPATEIAASVDRRIAAAELWAWDEGGTVSLSGVSTAVHGAVRIGPVFTPLSARRRGYASALVAHQSAVARAGGLRCLLYADLADPTSNGIYRAIGYRAVSELVRYEFDTV